MQIWNSNGKLKTELQTEKKRENRKGAYLDSPGCGNPPAAVRPSPNHNPTWPKNTPSSKIWEERVVLILSSTHAGQRDVVVAFPSRWRALLDRRRDEAHPAPYKSSETVTDPRSFPLYSIFFSYRNPGRSDADHRRRGRLPQTPPWPPLAPPWSTSSPCKRNWSRRPSVAGGSSFPFAGHRQQTVDCRRLGPPPVTPSSSTDSRWAPASRSTPGLLNRAP
jgi:hypothetical protein